MVVSGPHTDHMTDHIQSYFNKTINLYKITYIVKLVHPINVINTVLETQIIKVRKKSVKM